MPSRQKQYAERKYKMKQLLKILIALTITGSPLHASSLKGDTLVVKTSRTLLIGGPIDSSIVGGAVMLLSLEGTGPIYFIINSPGGKVFAGLQLISAMKILKYRGIEIHCMVSGMAASMAFQIFNECTHRYALSNSLLSWHPIRASVEKALTPKVAMQLAEDMERYEKGMVDALKDQLRISDQEFDKHYYNETLHLGEGLKQLAPHYLTIVKDVRGIKNIFNIGK